MTSKNELGIRRRTMKTYEKALLAMKGYTTRQVALALNRMTPGVDWRGCGKQHMAREIACHSHGLNDASTITLALELSEDPS